MAHIALRDVQAWLEKTKGTLDNVDIDLEAQIAVQTLARVAQAYDVSGWTDSTTTPAIVRSVIALLYAASWYNRMYSEDQSDTNDYARLLAGMANDLIAGIVDGTVDIVEVVDPVLQGTSPTFYPTDVSSAQCPTSDDRSLGGPMFSMGSVF